MSTPVILALLWLVVGNVSAMFPSKRAHWPTAYVLMAIGLPLLIWIFIEDGIWIALLMMAAAMSVLRWPVWYAWRRIKARIDR